MREKDIIYLYEKISILEINIYETSITLLKSQVDVERNIIKGIAAYVISILNFILQTYVSSTAVSEEATKNDKIVVLKNHTCGKTAKFLEILTQIYSKEPKSLNLSKKAAKLIEELKIIKTKCKDYNELKNVKSSFTSKFRKRKSENKKPVNNKNCKKKFK